MQSTQETAAETELTSADETAHDRTIGRRKLGSVVEREGALDTDGADLHPCHKLRHIQCFGEDQCRKGGAKHTNRPWL